VDLHPEELLDRARNRTASKEELARVDTHVANCAACRIEQELLVEIEQSVAAQPNDELVAARIRAFVGRAVAEREAGSAFRKRGAARKWATFAFAATFLLTTIGAAAVIFRDHRRRAAEHGTDLAISPTPLGPSLVVEDPAAQNAPGDEAKDLPDKVIDKAAEIAPGARSLVRSPRSGVKAERPKATDETAAELFARANQLRRRDEVNEAALAYRELQRSFPGSAEDLLSRVVLGRLLLDRLGDGAAAFVQFESYLNAAPQGSLREEALVGRAVALGRLGRVAEERKAWNALLETFPRSTSAARARARIAAIAP
jgi:TolA-binding protein